MEPVSFECKQIIPRPAVEISNEIADLSRWNEFNGYAFLPGIESAEYLQRTEDMVGSRIKVVNSDGSHHIEEILEWLPGQRIVIELSTFSPPLNRIAQRFVEEWTFQPDASATLVIRKLDLYPQRGLYRPVLWMISLLLRRAISQHLEEMS